ncbi:hypothetical protein [Calothrix sp. CCY 0018]|uniref:hypothetical protein n=1 Tax=Calothrix sp. CCY 0018 TaxID=3103864 RepID=UPI0039C65D0D
MQIELFNTGLYIKGQIKHERIYDSAWDLLPDAQSTCKIVGEQVNKDTKKTAPQHERESTHWVEKYWVERGCTKYWYFRYMWMEGRKIKRKYLGSVTSTKARYKKVIVEEAILDGLSPSEIVDLIENRVYKV